MRRVTFLLIVTALSSVATAQNNINSPFSSLGFGELGGLDHAVFSGIGNSTITLQDSTVLNFYNPSSYYSLAKGQPIFSVGVSSRLTNSFEAGSSSFNSVSSIQHFAMAFPFAKILGLAFGLKPYSRRGYEFSSKVAVNDDSLYYNYSGTGGINEVFIGISANVLNFKGTNLSIGGNMGYLFGSITNFKKSGLISSGSSFYAGGVSTKELRVHSFHYELGASFSQKIKQKHVIGLSAVVDPFQKFKGEYEEGLFYSADVDNINNYDTLTFNDTLTGNISNIPTFTYGFSYTLRGKGRKGQANEINSELSFHATYSTSNWLKYENRFDANFVNSFLNTRKLTFGIQYTPETDFINNKVATKFYHRIRYRAGIYQNTLPYEINGEQVSDFGTTFGFGIPIVVQNSLSSINIGFSVGKRGVSDPDAFKEQYYGINVGVSIAPGSDRWFVKRKLN